MSVRVAGSHPCRILSSSTPYLNCTLTLLNCSGLLTAARCSGNITTLVLTCCSGNITQLLTAARCSGPSSTSAARDPSRAPSLCPQARAPRTQRTAPACIAGTCYRSPEGKMCERMGRGGGGGVTTPAGMGQRRGVSSIPLTLRSCGKP